MELLPTLVADELIARRASLRQRAERVLRRGVADDSEQLPALVFDLLQAGLAGAAHDLFRDASGAWLSPTASAVASRQPELWARVLYSTRRWDELLELLASIGPALAPETRGLICMRAAWASLRRAQPENASGYFALARDCYTVAPSIQLAAELRFFSAVSIASTGANLVAAIRELQSTIALYREFDERLHLIQALITGAGFELRFGRPGNARALACEAIEVAAACGNLSEAAGALALLAVVCYREGRLELGIETIGRARELLIQVPDSWRQSQLALAAARIHLLREEQPEAMAAISEAADLLEAAPSAQLSAVLEEYRGIAALQSGDPLGALARIEDALRIFESAQEQGYFVAETLSWKSAALCALARPVEALKAAQFGLQVIDRAGELLDRGQVLHRCSIAALLCGDRAVALKYAEDAETHLRLIGDSHELACVLLTRAEHLAESPEQAIGCAAESVRLFEQCGVPSLVARAREVLQVAQVRRRVESMPEPTGIVELSGWPGIIAASPPMRALLTEVRKIASSRGAVLVTGETGVGKEIIARAIHDSSRPKRREFVPVNCAAIPETLFEREFFGHAKGAYTGADQDRPGLVELADGGTLFLDEVGELPAAMQAKLLRLLQDGTYRRVGDAGERTVSLRIVAATNRDLSRQVAEHRFREDLYYRLRIFEVEVPPLRERPEDIAPLAKLFLERESASLGTELWLEKAAWTALKSFPWPGNVRELEAAVLSATARADRSGCIRLEHLPRNVRQAAPTQAAAAMDLARHLEIEERRMIQLALDRAKQSKAEAARYLGISRNTLYDKMKRLGIEG